MRSELLKIRTTRAWWVLALVMFLYVGLTAAVFGYLFGQTDSSELDAYAGTSSVSMIASLAMSTGYVFALIIGSLIVTTEFRTRTIIPTYLSNPDRLGVLMAKVGAGIVMGVVYAVVGLVAAVGVGGGLLEYFAPGSLAQVDGLLVVRVAVALVLWTVIGVTLGSVVTSQVVAIVLVLVFTQVVEPILRVVALGLDWPDESTAFLPGAAADNFVGVSLLSGISSDSGLPWWGSGFVLAGYALVFFLIGWIVRARTDVA
ncbi:MAG TPA: ABC transporter permease subunit [Pseudoclavibacter sp.]|nr:ABC transporter permease subunit [Pseudoclavibacter sp.]